MRHRHFPTQYSTLMSNESNSTINIFQDPEFNISPGKFLIKGIEEGWRKLQGGYYNLYSFVVQLPTATVTSKLEMSPENSNGVTLA